MGSAELSRRGRRYSLLTQLFLALDMVVDVFAPWQNMSRRHWTVQMALPRVTLCICNTLFCYAPIRKPMIRGCRLCNEGWAMKSLLLGSEVPQSTLILHV